MKSVPQCNCLKDCSQRETLHKPDCLRMAAIRLKWTGKA